MAFYRSDKRFLFSNFDRFNQNLIYDGVEYNTVENFYQAMKTKDKDIRKKIATMHPAEAKKFARTIQLRSDWEDIKIKVMKYALDFKYKKNITHWIALINFEGDIVEYNYWHDNYWGHCLCTKCKDIPHQNHLGKLLEDLRHEIQEESQ